MDRASWVFDIPCKNDKIKRKGGGQPPEDIENFLVRKENFGTLYYAKSRTPVFRESYFVENESKVPNAQFILSAPILAILEITGKCNLNCIHCYRPEDKKEKTLELDVVKNLLSELKEMSVVGIQYMGGEPFLHKDLPKMLKESKKSEFKNEVITNGYKISESTIEECSDLIDGVFISIDGKKETHNKIRQAPDSFESAIKTLKGFSERDVYTTIVMTLNKLNYGDVEEIYDIVSSFGARELFLKRMLPVGRGKEHNDLYLGGGVISELENRVKIVLNDKTKVLFGARCVEPTGAYTFFGCPGGRTQIVIDCDGEVYKCLYKKDPNSYLGNIHNEPFRKIWNRNNETLENCDCTYSDRCGGLCELSQKPIC